VVVVAVPAMIVTTLDVDAAFVSVPMPVAMPVAVMITITLDDNGVFGVRRTNNRHAKAEYRNRCRDNDKTTHMMLPLCFGATAREYECECGRFVPISRRAALRVSIKEAARGVPLTCRIRVPSHGT
jgi:hypothetical protein